jgi:acetyltransferase-like isoleucine patch superfamily enzyme
MKNYSISNKIFARLEYIKVVILGSIFGISAVVRYLRNPNPIITCRLLRKFGATIGDKTTFKRTIIIDNAFEDANSTGDFSHIQIGSNCYIGDMVYMDLSNKIIIENNVVVSGKVNFITHADCNRSPILNNLYPRKTNPITLKEGCWIGFGAIILDKVTVGNNSIVGAESLVNGDIESNSIYLGIPAKKYSK